MAMLGSLSDLHDLYNVDGNKSKNTLTSLYVREAEAAFILAIDSGLGRLLCELDRTGLPEALGSGP